MNSKWKGALIGAIIGVIVACIFVFIDLGTSFCVQGFNLQNFFCSVSDTFNEFGLLAVILSIPKLLIKNILGLSGMNEIIIPWIILISGIIIGLIIGYFVGKRNEKQ